MVALAAGKYLKETIGVEKGIIVDLGCGAGDLLGTLSGLPELQRIGVDCSEHMIALAQKLVPNATFVKQSNYDFSIPRCHYITATGEVLNYDIDRLHTPKQLRHFFQKAYDALVPGGLLLFDLIEAGLYGEKKQQQKMVESEAWTMFLDHIENETGTQLTRNITFFIKDVHQNTYQRFREIHQLRLFNRAEVMEMLNQTGFDATIKEGYGTFVLREKNYVVECRKIK